MLACEQVNMLTIGLSINSLYILAPVLITRLFSWRLYCAVVMFFHGALRPVPMFSSDVISCFPMIY